MTLLNNKSDIQAIQNVRYGMEIVSKHGSDLSTFSEREDKSKLSTQIMKTKSLVTSLTH